MTEYHESWDVLPEDAKRFHRALKSLQEELEAVDWYHQRLAVTADQSLVDVLAHNRDEEMEHASMLLEWLRRNMPGWDGQLRKYLFTGGDLTTLEQEAEKAEAGEPGEGRHAPKPGARGAGLSDLGLGDLKGER